MKTILYNPIFINPQAYYVFPRLTRYLQPDNESTAEPANYIGTIEVKVIAYGDTTLKRTYTNTDSIDLSEFKNTWVRISLFTKVGSCVLGEWKIGNMESDLPYIDPEVLASLKAVVIVGNKTNNDSDRAIVKNLVDPDNPFVISNAAFKLNSGFGKYEVDFTSWIQTNGVIASSDKVQNSITGRFLYFNTVNKKEDVPSFKVNITLGQQSKLQYNYIKEDGTSTYIVYSESGIYTIPASYFSKYTGGNAWFGFYQIEGTSIIEQIPSFEGAFVTDGIDDLITSTKTVQEMLGGSNEITVVSMAHFIKGESNAPEICRINQIRRDTRSIRNSISKIGKSGIFGYTYKNGVTTINNILGDKKDCTAEGNLDGIVAPFSVEGYYYNNNSNPLELCSIAWYWTIIANKVLTTDQINQVIAYFNLDRTLKPDILCDVKKQGITNDNHAEFGDKLIDFSGNGRDIQLNNIAWKRDSGIGKYETELSNTSIWTQSKKTTSSPFSSSYNGLSGWIVFANTELTNSADMPSFKIQVKGLLEGQELIYRYYDSNGQSNVYSMTKDGEYTLPSDVRTAKPQTSNTSGFQVVKNETNIITITQIPFHAGALCLDGVNDFGKVTGMPIYKDYTFIIEREFLNETFPNQVCLVSKSKVASEIENGGAFIVDNISVNSIINPYSFYKTTSLPGLNTFDRQIVFQSKYKYLDKDIAAGTATDSDTLWLGTFRDNDSRFANVAIYSLMSFPYSMSEFLIERQLKKYKLGSLYPNMVEFRPVIKANANYNIFYTALLPLTGIVWEKINIGDYIPVGRRVAIQLSFDNEASELVSAISSQLGNISITKNSNNKGYTIFGDILKNKSPQKINITIDEYIRYEDIVQPYPVLLRFNDENGNEVSWGGKFRVGSTITRIGSAADSNLLPNIYNIFGLLLNDNQVTSSKVIVEKTMVFKAKSAYIFDNNEPKVILSPSRLRIPNSSYKILGYIPDISGHGNHGVIHNSAYKLNSGANGYLVDFTTFQDDGIKGIVRTDSKIYLDKSFNYNQGFWLGRTNSPSPAYKVKISGIPETGMLTYTGGIWLNLVNGINELPARTNTEEEHGFVAQSPNLDWSNLVIEQIGEYEGAYCLDGVDDFVTIPTLSSGGKQVLMKVNWNTLNSVLYDQRNGIEVPFCIGTGSGTIAYNHRNVGGNTFIDGILNNHILTDDLQAITHNIVLNNDYNVTNSNLFIGTNYIKSIYTKMALYDFMLFDNISTDDKIKELNEYVGIEAKVELPPYYWDAYGKTNLDVDKATIQQRGVAEGDYDITNYNHAYDKMSGYGGYNLGRFDKSWASSSSSNTSIKVVQRNPYDITLKKLGGNSDWEFNNTELKVISNPVSVKFKSNKNIRVTCDYHYYPVGGNSEGTPLGITSKDLIANKDAIITISPISQENIDKYNIDVNRGYYLIYFQLSSTLAVNEEVTIEMLPLYPNGLVCDGVTDYSENANIPALTDFTYVFKRKLLDNVAGCASMTKGLTDQQRAVVIDYINTTGGINGTSFGNMAFVPSLRDSDIIYSTTTNINGTTITKGNNPDSNGIDIGKFATYYKKMVFYKLILYPKTIPLLQINFLKNLMERDEIIDLNNKIFIQE